MSSRVETLLKAMLDDEVNIPEPQSRVEILLEKTLNDLIGGSGYTLPIGGDELGGVKNGGNVVINEDGTMTAPESEVTDEQVSSAVSDWLDEHPEATTSVQDGSISMEKLSSDVKERFTSLEAEVFVDEVTTEEVFVPAQELTWITGHTQYLPDGVLTANNTYNCTEFFETTVFPEITKPELLTQHANNYVSFKNGDVYVGYWKVNGKYYLPDNTETDSLTFTHASFCLKTDVDYTQVELSGKSEIIEVVTETSRISPLEKRVGVLEAEVFEEKVTTDTTEGVSPDVVLEWEEGYAYHIQTGDYSTNPPYTSTQKFETTVFPEITKPELLTQSAASLVAFWNGDKYVGYWSMGQYHNPSRVVVDSLTFTHAAFSIHNIVTDHTQIELVYAEVIETVTKISKIQDVRERTTALEYKTGVLETKVQALENGGASGGSGESGEGDTSRQGKKYYLFGDSITYWDSRTSWYDDTVYMVAYPSYIRDVLQAEIVNCGVAGNKAENITARLKTTNLTDAYAVTYMSGANDLNNKIPIGTIGTFDTTTYIGSIETAIKYVAENYPHVKFYLLSPLFTTLGDIKPYAEAMQSVADHYSIPILRWDKVSQINQFNSNYYTVEGVHPNNLGHALMADSLLPFLKNH